MKKTNLPILLLILLSFLLYESPQSYAQQLYSSTDSVIVATSNTVTDWGRGFKFTPTQDMWVVRVGKRVPAAGNYSWAIWDATTQVKLFGQTSLLDQPGQYVYEDVDSVIKLNVNQQYILELYGTGSAQYYYGVSSQAGPHITYMDMRFCGSCTPATFPTSIITGQHYGTPDFIYSLSPPVSGLNDAALAGPTSPVNFCPGTQTVKVKVSNPGINKIDSVKVAWTLDGVAQPVYNLTTPLDTFGGVGINQIEVTLGTHTFTANPVALKAWTFLPNNAIDTTNLNDTVSVTLQASLSGTYTINSAVVTGGTNYQSFADFSADLSTYGVCGPVIANVSGGPFIEKVRFGDIDGASATNTIRVNGNGATVQFSNTVTDRQLLTLEGTKYLTIDSLTFKSLATDYGWAALITGGSKHDSIINCFFDLTSVTSTSSVNTNGISFSSSATSATSLGSNGSHIYIGNNHLKWSDGVGGGYYALSMAGTCDSNVVENNIFENYYYYGTYLNGGAGNKIWNNKFHKENKTGSITTFYGIYTTGITPGMEIIGNRIHSPGGALGGSGTCYGINSLGDGTIANPVIIANNAIYNMNLNGTIYGIYLSTSPYNFVYHNTVVFDQPLAGTGTIYGIYSTGTNTNTEIKNNNVSITAGTTGTKYGFYYPSAASVADVQKNNFYINSTQTGAQNYGYYTSVYATQAAFQAAYPLLEVGSPTADPMFVGALTGNLNVQNPLLIGTGENLQSIVPTDINGNPRPATPSIGAFEQPPVGNNNAGMLSFNTPSGIYCAGQQSVSATINNAGINNINSVQIHWTVNGVAQPVVSYTSTLVPITSTGNNTASVVLGNANILNTAPTLIKAWTSMPNGVADTLNNNDTISLSFQATQFLASSGTDTVCSGANATINLSPNTGYAVGDLQWQSSPNGTTWTSIPGTDAPTYTANNVTSNVFYRAKIGTGTNVCYSNAVSLSVITVSLLSSTPGERCGDGTVSLSAVGAPGTTINWYSQASGGSAIGTGSPFNTPSISATTTFYASAGLGSGSGLIAVGAGALTSVSGASEYSGVSFFAYHYGNYKHQLLFTASELNALGMSAGEFTSIAFDIADVGSPAATFNNFTISIKGTSAPVMVDNFQTGLTTVFTGNHVPTLGMNTFTFSTPFVWDGVSNIVIQTCYNNNNSGVVGSSAEVKYDLTSFVSHTVYRADGTQNTICDVPAGNSGIDGPTSSKRPKVVFNFNGGCESPRVPVLATIKPTPTVNLGNDTTICPGATLTLNAGNPGNTYLWNNNSTAQTLNVTAAGTYSVKVTGTNTCSKSDTIVITAGAVPLNNLPAITDLCEGDTTTLDAGNLGSSYLWSNTDTTQTTNVSAAGVYSVVIKSLDDCSLTSNTTVTIRPLPIVDLGVDTAICTGDQILLNAGNVGMNYLWNTGVNTQTIIADSARTYSVTVTSSYNCKGRDTISVTTLPLPTVDAFNTIDLSNEEAGKMQFNAVNPQNVTSYDWDFGDNSTHGTTASPIHVYTSNGTFTVTLKVMNDCGEDEVSFTVTIEGVGIAKLNDKDVNFTLYPNPTTAEVVITNGSADVTMQHISIVNVLGAVVFEKATSTDKVQKVNVSNLASGLYTARVMTDKGLVVMKFEVIK